MLEKHQATEACGPGLPPHEMHGEPVARGVASIVVIAIADLSVSTVRLSARWFGSSQIVTRIAEKSIDTCRKLAEHTGEYVSRSIAERVLGCYE